MKPSYAFSDFMLPKNMAEKTQVYERPTREVQVSSEDEMIKVFRGMIISGSDKITLRCPERFYNTFLRDDGLLWRCLARVGIEKCDCNHRNNVIRISKLVLFSHWAYCEKAEDVTKAAENILANNVQKFTFVFEPKLFQQSFSAKTKFTKLRYLLASGGLEFESCQYSENACTITVMNIKPYDAFVSEISTAIGIELIVKKGCRSGKSVLDLWFTPLLFQKVMKNQELLFSPIRNMGINKEISYSYSQDNSRIKIQLN